MKGFTLKAGTACLGLCAISTPALAAPPERRMDISADMHVQYDSNIARTSPEGADARGLKRSDITATPSVDLDIALPVGPHFFNLAGSVGYDFHARNSSLNRERISLDGTAAFDLPICDPTLNAGISRKQSDLGAIGVYAGDEAASIKNTETVVYGGGTLTCGGAFGLRPYGTVNYTHAENSNFLRQRTDYDTFSYGGGVSYDHPSIGNVKLFVNRAETRFKNQVIPTIGKAGYNLTSYGASFQRSIGSRLTGAVSLSHTSIDSRTPGVKEFSGLSWSGDLTGKVNERLVVHAGLSREVVSTLAVDAAYHLDKLYVIDATYALTGRLTVKAGYSHAPRRFYGADTTFGPALEHDVQRIAFATFTYARSQRLQFSLEGARESRNANGTFYDYKNTRIGVRTSLKF